METGIMARVQLEYEGLIIIVSVNDKGWNNWFITKGDDVLDCAQYHSPTHNELATKVQAERALTDVLQKIGHEIKIQ